MFCGVWSIETCIVDQIGPMMLNYLYGDGTGACTVWAVLISRGVKEKFQDSSSFMYLDAEKDTD
jgi:hypothetical protein